VRVHANDNGFVSECQIYTGKIGQAAEKNLGARVIYDLTKDLEEKQHYMYFDSYFTHVAFLKALNDKGIHVFGTEERERVGMPKNFVSKTYEKRQL
jgi:DNA-binding PadR family transcriptional regulator